MRTPASTRVAHGGHRREQAPRRAWTARATVLFATRQCASGTRRPGQAGSADRSRPANESYGAPLLRHAIVRFGAERVTGRGWIAPFANVKIRSRPGIGVRHREGPVSRGDDLRQRQPAMRL